MFSYANRQQIAEEILRYFQDNVGTKSDDVELSGNIDWITSEELKDKYIQLFEAKDVPYEVIPSTVAFRTLFDEEVFSDYEIRYVLMNLPEWTDKSKCVQALIAETVRNSNGQRLGLISGFPLLQKDDEESIMDDYFSCRLQGYDLSEISYEYICIAVEDVPILSEICSNNNISCPKAIAIDDLDWCYFLSLTKKSRWENNQWVSDDKNYEYRKCLGENFIPYVLVQDYHKRISVFPAIPDEKYRAKYRKDIGKAQRSSWEANVSRVLNHCGVNWEYERNHYDLSDELSYLPDFFIGEDTILEVKGFWDADSRKKVTLFQKAHPEIRLLILDADMYPSIRNKYKDCIPEWEEDGGRITSSETIPIVGMKFCASAETIKSLSVGDRILFKREPENKYDKYAILAINEEGEPIGHVGSDWAFIYASKMDLGMEYEARIKDIEKKVIQVIINRTNNDKAIVFDLFT